MSSFENLRIVDNFYQTSLYFPMPTVIISTLCEDGSTTLGPYSLVQPYWCLYTLLILLRVLLGTVSGLQNKGKNKTCPRFNRSEGFQKILRIYKTNAEKNVLNG